MKRIENNSEESKVLNRGIGKSPSSRVIEKLTEPRLNANTLIDNFA